MSKIKGLSNVNKFRDERKGTTEPIVTWYSSVEKDLSSIGLSRDIAAPTSVEKLYCPMCSARDGPRRIINP